MNDKNKHFYFLYSTFESINTLVKIFMIKDRDIIGWRNKIRKGDRVYLSRAITLAESLKPEDRKFIHNLMADSSESLSVRIAITGPPGVGKSTFIEASGSFLSENHHVAILTIDPTSPVSGGSILGDKTRMEKLSGKENVFIRPSPSGLQGGGIAAYTHDAIRLCEYAGYNLILIETVGVGQSEIAVRQLCDHFILLMLASGGDDLQGIKRGIMELADTFILNKSDDTPGHTMKKAQSDLKTALGLLRQDDPKIYTVSSLKGENIQETWEEIMKSITLEQDQEVWEIRRKEQLESRFEDSLKQHIWTRFRENPRNEEMIRNLKKDLTKGNITFGEAIERFLDIDNE